MPETAAAADTRTPSGRLALAASPEKIALGPLDGRYQSAVAPLVDYLSEAALNRDRVAVEVEWLIHLTSNNVLPGAGPLTPEQQEIFEICELGYPVLKKRDAVVTNEMVNQMREELGI